MMDMKLENIVKHAYATSTVYETLGEKNGIAIEGISKLSIEDFPVIEKDYFMENESGRLSSEYIVKAYRDELLNVRSSGSTGKYLNIYWDKADFTRSLLPLWLYRKKYYDIDADDKMCYFYTARNVGNMEQRTYQYKNQLGFSKNNLDIEGFRQIYEDMKGFKPKWLNIQPSIASLFCQSIRKLGLSGLDSIKYVEFTGEMLSKSVRHEVEEIFNCKTANQYGTNETNSIAYECPYGNMHILQSNVYVEVLDKRNHLMKDGEEGDICITSLTNKAMPFVRYRVGDRGFKMSNVKCRCGNCSEVIDITAGRKNDYAIDEYGEKVNSYVFVRAIDNMNIILDGAIKQFQIEQRAINDFIVRLVVDEDVELDEIEEIFYDNMIQSSLAESVFLFELYEELFPDEGTGKLRYFISKIEA